MNKFKEFLMQDLDNVFFNEDEFCDEHFIDGKKKMIIIDNDRLMERSKKEFEGLSIGEILYFIKAKDFGELPEQGTPQTFDGRIMYVFNAREDNGVYEIILNQNMGS